MDFSIREVAQIPIENFRLLEILYEIEFSNFERTFSEAIDLVENMIANLVETLNSKMLESDKISINFFHNMFYAPITIPFIIKKEFTVGLIMNYLCHVTQSYKDLQINPNNTITISLIVSKFSFKDVR